MLREAQQKLVESSARFKFEVINAQSIPFERDSFDAVIAILVMHHVPDVGKAFSEIHRVLKPGGRFYVGATGKAHMRELEELMARVNVPYRPRGFETFSLDDGSGRLLGWFREATVYRYEDSLVVTEIQPMLDYVLSLTSRPVGERWSAFVRMVESEIGSKGSIRITKDVGVFDARKAEGP